MSTARNARAVLVLMAELGLSPEDLRRAATPVPTLADYLPRVLAAASAGARRTYGTYWTRIRRAFGDRALDEITATDIEALMREVMRDCVRRRNSRGGTSAGEHLLMAMRAIYTRAVADELIAHGCNPAARVGKPHRPPTTRRALSTEELSAINHAVATGGNDATLDCLLVRLHVETACRRGAALALQDADLDPEWDLVRLQEKNDNVRWQPVSPSLMRALLAHPLS